MRVLRDKNVHRIIRNTSIRKGIIVIPVTTTTNTVTGEDIAAIVQLQLLVRRVILVLKANPIDVAITERTQHSSSQQVRRIILIWNKNPKM
uniref:SJCHGC08285 protein n=1 Tax=Schistosoma japonicum TaxID=6182 RepID=Q5BRH4_SCHJA|nr:SJCHGC08285 protein [Schistosoma japonicum]